MHALTFHQPWAHAICHLGKRVENRGWALPRWLLGRSLAIHAGKSIASVIEDADDLRAEGFDVPWELVLGAVVAVATVSQRVTSAADLRADQRRWWVGPHGWCFTHVVALQNPVPARGLRFLWPLPVEVERQVIREWRHAVAATIGVAFP